MTATKTTANEHGTPDSYTGCEIQPSAVPVAYRRCPICKEIYAEALCVWHNIILDGDQIKVCAGCERRLTRLVEG